MSRHHVIPWMGDIGEGQREIELEPIETPRETPAPVETPQPSTPERTPAPTREPVPA